MTEKMQRRDVNVIQLTGRGIEALKRALDDAPKVLTAAERRAAEREEKKQKIDAAISEVREQIFGARQKGYSASQIAATMRQALGLPVSSSTIQSVLKEGSFSP